jgi:hypothetical protein
MKGQGHKKSSGKSKPVLGSDQLQQNLYIMGYLKNARAGNRLSI